MDDNSIKLFGSKKTDNWRTPRDLYSDLADEFNFTFDPCPFKANFDGLKCDWGKRCFVNPPYSKVKEFLIKAWEEIHNGNTDIAIFLTFANTDTAWFHDFIYGKAEIRFIRGRLKFLDEDYNSQGSAMRPSMIAILRSERSKRSGTTQSHAKVLEDKDAK